MNASRTAHAHRHTPPGQHEHEYEPQLGLPEPLPAGEKLLWQGSPCWKTLAVRRFHVRKLMVYFGVLLAARVASLGADGLPLSAALAGSTFLLVLAAIAVGLVALIAWFTARTTVYTLTDRRVVMRIGIVLTITLNLPYKRLEAADLNLHSGAVGDIALRLLRPDHIAYLHLWPHARPWRLARPEPSLLCIADAQAVASQLTTAWQALNAAVQRQAGAAPPQAATPAAGSAHTAAAQAAVDGRRGELSPTLATR